MEHSPLPIIDLAALGGDPEARRQMLAKLGRAARDIGFYATHDVRFRVVRDDALNEPLMTWTKQDGWKEWRHAER